MEQQRTPEACAAVWPVAWGFCACKAAGRRACAAALAGVLRPHGRGGAAGVDRTQEAARGYQRIHCGRAVSLPWGASWGGLSALIAQGPAPASDAGRGLAADVKAPAWSARSAAVEGGRGGGRGCARSAGQYFGRCQTGWRHSGRGRGCRRACSAAGMPGFQASATLWDSCDSRLCTITVSSLLDKQARTVRGSRA